MTQYMTRKVSRGRHIFDNGQVISIDDDAEAEELIAARAIVPMDDPSVDWDAKGDAATASNAAESPSEDDAPAVDQEPAENRSAATMIRDELAKTPEASNKEIVDRLAEQDVKITSSQVTAERKKLDD